MDNQADEFNPLDLDKETLVRLHDIRERVQDDKRATQEKIADLERRVEGLERESKRAIYNIINRG